MAGKPATASAIGQRDSAKISSTSDGDGRRGAHFGRTLSAGSDGPRPDRDLLSWTMRDNANLTVFELAEALRPYGWQVAVATHPERTVCTTPPAGFSYASPGP